MPNALIHESSPYLRRISQQPVRWLPWSEAVFEKARQENRPILLSIGAAWCHWCHVMDRESFENPDIAAQINDHFVAVKVDRDEHPEVDRRFQASVVALTGQGGWPLTAFLTPDGRVFAGGNYFPPVTRWGQRGFREVLGETADSFLTAGPSVRAVAEQVRQAEAPAAGDSNDIGPDMVDDAIRTLMRDFDFIHGGFGEAPRFPHPMAAEVLMAACFRSKDSNQELIVRRAMESVIRGGLHDHLGGGFFRYSSSEDWMSPHFEKILNDNAEMLRTCARSYTFLNEPQIREAAEGVVNWTRMIMTDRDGGFFHSQDADAAPGDDGTYYTWTLEEARRELTDKEMQILSSYYNIRHLAGRNLLYNERTLQDIADELSIPVTLAGGLLAAGKDKLYWARRKRAEPPVDPVRYTSSCGHMISAHIEASRTLQLPAALDAAYRALERMLREAWNAETGFAHGVVDGKPHLPGLLEDQVFGGLALLDGHLDSENPLYLEQAIDVARVLRDRYHDPVEGGFFDVAVDFERPPALAAHKPVQDAPSPGANSAAIIFLLRLHSLTGESEYSELAEQTLRAFAGLVRNWGLFACTYFTALQQFLEGAFEVIIVGEREHPDAEALRDVAWRTYRPRKEVRRLTPDAAAASPAVQGMVEFIRRKRKPMAFVCIHGSCTAPVEEPEALQELMRTFNP